MPKITQLVTETIHLDQEVSEVVDTLAEAYGISRRQLLQRIIREHLETIGAVEWPPELDEDSPVSGEA